VYTLYKIMYLILENFYATSVSFFTFTNSFGLVLEDWILQIWRLISSVSELCFGSSKTQQSCFTRACANEEYRVTSCALWTGWMPLVQVAAKCNYSACVKLMCYLAVWRHVDEVFVTSVENTTGCSFMLNELNEWLPNKNSDLNEDYNNIY
jgi:hypothetical protein